MPFLTPLGQEWKELTAKPTAQGSPALHKAEAGNPTARTGAAAQPPSPPITINSLCKGPGLKPSVPAGHVPPLPPGPHVWRGGATRQGRALPHVCSALTRLPRRTGSQPSHTPRPRKAEPSTRAARLNTLK